ncbi:hypothetical protein DPQ26_12800 [Bacillus sp. E25]|nr:hypothetical protein DOS87_13035 [Bacillus sp. CR71]AXR22680.1 hypothetical protein DPQ26_12800 [Bacillus sp. E25]
MEEYMVEHIEWIFSGIGVLVISTVGGIFLKKRKDAKNIQSINSGDNSTNIQGGRDVKVTFGEKNER